MKVYTVVIDFTTLKGLFQSLKATATTKAGWSQIQRNPDQNKINRNSFRDESLALIDQFFCFIVGSGRAFMSKTYQ